MTRDQRIICEQLSLQLYGNKNAYRRIERRGLPIPQIEMHSAHGKEAATEKLIFRRVRLTDDGIISLLKQELIKREEAKASEESEKENESTSE